MENGSVWNIKSNDQFKTIEKNLLIQLPKSQSLEDLIPFKSSIFKHYHTFSTKAGVLNFVKDDISSNIIKYHKSLNSQNHMKVQKSSVQFKDKIDAGFLEADITAEYSYAGLMFRHGIQVSSMFWLVFGEYPVTSHFLDPTPITDFKSSTMIWFSNKQRWRRGPDLQLNPEPYNNLCSSSLNSTAVLFVFIGKIHKNGGQLVTKVAIFNFQSNVWIDMPKMKEELQDVYMTCAMAILFDKQRRPKAVVVFSGI